MAAGVYENFVCEAEELKCMASAPIEAEHATMLQWPCEVRLLEV